MVTWILLWLQMGVDVQHYQIGQYQTEAACLDAKEQAAMLAPQDNQVLYCFKVYTKGISNG